MSSSLVARLLQSTMKSGAILCGHGIALHPYDPAIHMSPEEVVAAVRIARDLGTVVPLAELVDRWNAGRSTSGLFALTFDDGYASLSSVLPLLDRQGVPTTIFIVTNAARTGVPFWWDRLEVAFRTARPESRADFLNALLLDAPTLGATRDQLLVRYRGRSDHLLDEALGTLEDASGVRTSQRPMTFDELRQIPRSETLSFGVHTRTHALLPLLSPSEVLDEIRMGHAELREHLDDRVVSILAAPFGLYDARTNELARTAGMTGTLSLNNVSLRSRPVSGTLPRICLVRKQRKLKLLLKLSGAADILQRQRGELEDPPIPAGPMDDQPNN